MRWRRLWTYRDNGRCGKGEVVVAHNERATLRVSDVFLKIDADQRRTQVEVEAMAMAQILCLLDAAGLDIWVDGGWGVDALEGEQTREHKDLDLGVARTDLDRTIEVLGTMQYAVSDDRYRQVTVRLADADGDRIDLHPSGRLPDGGRRNSALMIACTTYHDQSRDVSVAQPCDVCRSIVRFETTVAGRKSTTISQFSAPCPVEGRCPRGCEHSDGA